MKKVLFVGPNFKRRQGGISSVLFQYEAYLGDDFNFFPSAYFRTTWLNFLLLPFALILFFTKLLFNSRFEIIHIHGSFKGSFYRKYFFYLIAKKIYGRKVVYHIHGSEYHLFYENASAFIKKKVSAMVEGIDALIVLSKEWQSFFDKNFDQPNIFILNNIVEENEYHPKKINHTIKMLFLGRIGERKGTFDLLNAIKKNKSEFKGKVHFYIGGDGETARLNTEIQEYQLEELVEFLGWIKGDKKKELLRNSHLMILPSFNEGLPISLLEAMANGMPLISTHVGGIANILDNGSNGFVVEPGNADQIGKAIASYIETPDLINLHGKKSYSIAEQFFPANVFAQLNEIYSQALR